MHACRRRSRFTEPSPSSRTSDEECDWGTDAPPFLLLFCLISCLARLAHRQTDRQTDRQTLPADARSQTLAARSQARLDACCSLLRSSSAPLQTHFFESRGKQRIRMATNHGRSDGAGSAVGGSSTPPELSSWLSVLMRSPRCEIGLFNHEPLLRMTFCIKTLHTPNPMS